MVNAVNMAATADVAASPYLETVKTWVTYIGVLVVALVTAYAGIRKALKDLKTGDAPVASKQEVLSATLVETHTMVLWSESNRQVCEGMHALCTVLTRMLDRAEVVEELKKEAIELRHQIERLRDRI